MNSLRSIKVMYCNLGVLSLASFLLPGKASGQIFFDGNFLDSNWQYTDIVFDDPQIPGTGPGTSTASTFRADNAGNPGAYRASTHNIAYGDTIYSRGLMNSAIYVPVASGPIQSIDFTIDLQHPGTGSTAWQLTVEQAGTVYYSYPLGAFSQNPFWNDFSWTNLTQADFDTNPLAGALGQSPDGNSPNFSSTGNPLKFGYALGNTNASGVPGIVTTTHGVDNWRVEINPGIPGDFDSDGDVDGNDFLVWQRNPGIGNLADWQANYGQPLVSVTTTVPEPQGLTLVGMFLASFLGWRGGHLSARGSFIPLG